MSTTITAPALDPTDIGTVAGTLVELSAYPTDRTLLDRAAQQVPALGTRLRTAAGHTPADDDSDWLTAWTPTGIVVTRNGQ